MKKKTARSQAFLLFSMRQAQTIVMLIELEQYKIISLPVATPNIQTKILIFVVCDFLDRDLRGRRTRTLGKTSVLVDCLPPGCDYLLV